MLHSHNSILSGSLFANCSFQTLPQTKTKNMLIRVDGELGEGVTSKDIILYVIGLIGTAGGTGYTIEFGGSAIRALSMEARMSISNMAIEAGARAGIIAPDEVTFEYLKNRPMSPSGKDWDKAVAYWKSLCSDEGAEYDETIVINAKDISPSVTWGTSPQDVIPVTGSIPMIDAEGNSETRKVRRRWMLYLDCLLVLLCLFADGSMIARVVSYSIHHPTLCTNRPR